MPSGSICRSAVGACDQNDFCDGSSSTCPDTKLPSGTVCRSASGVCVPLTAKALPPLALTVPAELVPSPQRMVAL